MCSCGGSKPKSSGSKTNKASAKASCPKAGGGIEWKKQPGASDEDLEKAKKMWEDAKKRRLPDGTKPETVIAMEALECSDKKTTISVGPDGNSASPDSRADSQDPTKGSNSNIKFNPNKTSDYSDGTPRDPESSLAHEAVHAHEYSTGTSASTREEREVSAGNAENQHRKAKGLDQREKYGNQWPLQQY